MVSVLEQLGVNVASVVIGAMLFLMAVSWIDAFKALTDRVFFDDGKEGIRYSHNSRKKLISAICTTILAIAIIIVVYTFYSSELSEIAGEIESDFPGIVPEIVTGFGDGVDVDGGDMSSSSLASVSMIK